MKSFWVAVGTLLSLAPGLATAQPSPKSVELSAACRDTSSSVKPSQRVLLLGDSHGAHLFSGLQAVVSPAREFRALTKAACPPVPQLPVIASPHCGEFNEFAMTFVAQYRPELVIVASGWTGDGNEYQSVEQTVMRLKALDVRRVLLVGPVAVFDVAVYKQAESHWSIPQRLASPRLPALWTVDSVLRAIARRTGAEVASPLGVQCNKADCITALGPRPDQLLTWDHSHLTDLGSLYLVERLLRPFVTP